MYPLATQTYLQNIHAKSWQGLHLLHHVADREVPGRSSERATSGAASGSLIMPVFSKGSRFHDASVPSHRAWTVQRRVGEGQSAEVYSVRCEQEPSTQVG